MIIWIIAVLTLSEPVWARPEYAAREKQNCTSCHHTPWGGGPRNLTGKAYGTHGFSGSFTSAFEYFYGDLRAVAYGPFKRTSDRTSGQAMMEAAATGTVPVIKTEETEGRVLLTYNISPLGGGYLRDAYFQYRSSSSTRWTFGHMYLPFGLLTDYHRTYTRLQTQTTINNYSTGIALSHDVSSSWHLDLMLANDFQSGGGFSQNNLRWTLGAVGNLRWMPASAPVLVGLSSSVERTSVGTPWALSLYQVTSIARLSILSEAVLAKKWNDPLINVGQVNPSLLQYFLGAPLDPNGTSLGVYAALRYDLNPRWILQYQLDWLFPTISRGANDLLRNGVGFEFRTNAHSSIITRVEFVSSPTVVNRDAFGAQNDLFAMFRLWV